MTTTIVFIILLVAILTLQLQILLLKKSIRITHEFVGDIATFLMTSKLGDLKKKITSKKKRGRPAKNNEK